MPRPKRALADLDSNAGAPASKKRSSTGGGKDTGPHTGQTLQVVQVDEAREGDGRKLKSAGAPKSAATAKGKKVTSGDGGREAQPEARELQRRYLTVCRPMWDIEMEKRRKQRKGKDGQGSSYQDVDEGEEFDGGNCMHGKPAEDRPDWTRIFTEAGTDYMQNLGEELEKRDQDMHDIYVFNDFSGYGQHEVVHNVLKDFNKEFSKKEAAPATFWSMIEGLACFVASDDKNDWFMIDDCDSLGATIEIVGVAVISTMRFLAQKGLLSASSPFKNIGLVAGLYLSFARDWEEIGEDCDATWASRLMSQVEKAGIKISGPCDIAETVESARDERYDEDKPVPKVKSRGKKIPNNDEDDEGNRLWMSWEWKNEFAAFKKDYFRPGSSFDISKFTKAKLKQHSLL
ncbi:MAG: hypothetical protein M1833_007326 [Piccolia ochrophora]|nr:MAG: hypothetical protein M1833_007326 [Piccolia ochrophora]